jgi:hypothetical protein
MQDNDTTTKYAIVSRLPISTNPTWQVTIDLRYKSAANIQSQNEIYLT